MIHQKSHEKNLALEEVWRRNEESMRRKQQIKVQVNGTPNSDAPPSPVSTGAMDDLLQKLRAAAPATKDQRDRRRRARLKDKHQVRVASGQQIPETGENVDESGLLSPTKTDASEPSSEGATSEGEDIADRAASLLQGLRGDENGEAPSRDESRRRRRESADDERARRRARRRAAGTSTDTAAAQSTIAEEAGEPAGDEDAESENKRSSGGSSESGDRQLPTPTTVVVPPSPTASERAGRLGEEDE